MIRHAEWYFVWTAFFTGIIYGTAWLVDLQLTWKELTLVVVISNTLPWLDPLIDFLMKDTRPDDKNNKRHER